MLTSPWPSPPPNASWAPRAAASWPGSSAPRSRRTRHGPGTATPARAGHGHACPFDLHALLPVPDGVLQRGPADPQALAWLAAHWGVTDRLRHVVLRPGATAGRRLPAGHHVVGYGFFTDGGTPNAALAQLGLRWPALRLVLQPQPAG